MNNTFPWLTWDSEYYLFEFIYFCNIDLFSFDIYKRKMPEVISQRVFVDKIH